MVLKAATNDRRHLAFAMMNFVGLDLAFADQGDDQLMGAIKLTSFQGHFPDKKGNEMSLKTLKIKTLSKKYPDWNRSDTGRAGSGIFSNTPGNDVKISVRNPDHCSVFRSELISINGALDHALNSYKDSYLNPDRQQLSQRKQVCLQWIPSHVGVPGNEAADELAGRGCDLPNPSSTD
ncbi:RNase H domain-containing protein [Trichonephila clavipes]|nr:RNase H domain-containing protein [Trichonephila clavipes]